MQGDDMSLKPLGDRLLVKPLEAQEKTSGGIFIPQTAQEKTEQATVVAIGDSEDIVVKIKDVIIHDKYAGTKYMVDGDEHLIIRMDDVLAIVE